MFGFFKQRNSEPQGVVAGRAAPGTHILFHPELIADLKAEHQELLAIFARMVELHEAGRHQRLGPHLKAFGDLLQDHVAQENVKLYIYLQRMLAEDPEQSQLMRQFRKEMHAISRAVRAFLQRYRDVEWTPEEREAFGKELAAIGDVLVQRVDKEEQQLYPLYQSLGVLGEA